MPLSSLRPVRGLAHLPQQALAQPDAAKAAPLWHQADMQIMRDAAIVPFQTQKTVIFHSSRTHNTIFLPFSQNYDITQVWLNPTS